MPRYSFRDPVSGVLKAHGFVDINQAGDLRQEEADDFALTPGLWCWSGEAWDAYEPDPVPDGRGFELAIHEVFSGADQAALNTLAGTFPLFLWALRDGTWAALGQMIAGALQAQVITQNQYTAILAAAATNHVPLGL